MAQGTMEIVMDGEGFALRARTGDQSVEMQMTLDELQGLSLALAELFSRHHKRRNEAGDPPPLLDIVAPDVSFSTSKMGVELMVSGHGLAPIKLTFPLPQAVALTRNLLEAAEKWAAGHA